MHRVTAIAPAKAILLGEHAVNQGQAALAVSIGLYTSCHITVNAHTGNAAAIRLVSGDRTETTQQQAIRTLGRMIDAYRADGNYAAIQHVAGNDFWAPTKYVLAALDDDLPPLTIEFTSNIPQSAGLGSGGASFVALAAGVAQLLEYNGGAKELAAWAHRGDLVAHGGVASGLDTQTSLFGGAIRYTAAAQGEPIPYASSLALVIGNTGVFAATSAVNGRVRQWLAERPARLHYFHEIGLLSRLAEAALRDGNWAELGRLLNLNQLVLERIGVSCPELEALIDAALGAGALGAKLSGSGGGGIMLALVTPERITAVADAITAAGGAAIVAPVGVPGVQTHSE